MLTGRRDFLKLTAGLVTSASLAPRIAVAQPAVRIGTAVLADYGLAGPVIVAAERATWRDYLGTVTDALGVEPEWTDEPVWTGTLVADVRNRRR